MEVALNNYLGPDDIQTGSWIETMHENGRMNKKAIKDTFFSSSSMGKTFRQIAVNLISGKGINLPRVVNTSIKHIYKDSLGTNPACPTAEMVMRYDPESWKNYFKFAFVRNPFDFEISDYFWRTKRLDKKLDFTEFLKRKLKIKNDPEGVVPFPKTNWSIYSINNEVVLDYIGIFEELNNHLNLIGKRIGLPLEVGTFPKVKSNYEKPSNFKDLYDDENKEMVYLLHKNEFDYFGYTYPY
tara:strand:- start:2860 stop:3579 length:720 start_codon:yes stop_codon:yes gene_type:complete